MYNYLPLNILAMENLPAFVNGIVQLWNINQYREQLYKEAMSMDNAGSLRRVYSQGYISSLLFKKDIQYVYDGIKCSLQDGDISKKILGRITPGTLAASLDKLSIARLVRDQEQKAIRIYKNFISTILISEDDTMLSDHLEKLMDIHYQIDRELSKSNEYLHAHT
jgi:hypothetical protein